MKQQPYVLVTGANGFLGATLVRKLIERGERVKAFVRPETNLTSLQGIPQDKMLLAVGNVMAQGSVYRALTGCTRVYHAAANFKLWDKNPKNVIDPAVVGMARDFAAGSKLVVVLGDNIFEHAHAGELRDWAGTDGRAQIFVKEVPDPENFGVVVYGDDGRVTDVVEKAGVVDRRYEAPSDRRKEGEPMRTTMMTRTMLGVVAAVALAVGGLGVLPTPQAAAAADEIKIMTSSDGRVVFICHYRDGKLLYCDVGHKR